jgi:gliding motility-associated-like protein
VKIKKLTSVFIVPKRLKSIVSFIVYSLLLLDSGYGQVVVVNNLLPADQKVCKPFIFGFSAVNAPPAASLNTIPGFTPEVMSYVETPIPFQAATPAGTVVNLTDDIPSGVLPIGFTFLFSGIPFTQFRISPNGFISLGAGLPTSLFSFDADAMAADHCDPTEEFPENAILGCYQDWNPNGVPNAIRYQTTGTAPNRILSVYYTSVPFFSTCGGTATFYIRLFETSNNIQIHIQNKPVCPDMWQGDSFSGITPDCDSDCPSVSSCAGADIAVNNTATQYTYSVIPYTGAAPATYSNPQLNWTGLQGATIATATTSFNPTINPGSGQALLDYPATAQNFRRFICKVTYDSNLPCGAPFVLVDTITFSQKPYDMAFTATTPICLNETSLITYEGTTPVATGAQPTVIAWNFGAGATPPTSNSLADQNVTWSTTGLKTVTLNLSGGGCSANDTSFTVEVVASPTSAFNFPASVCAESSANFSAVTPIVGATYLWTTDGGAISPAAGGPSISIAWNTPGTKTVTLQVTVGSCTSVLTSHTVTVKPRPSAAFNSAANSVCEDIALQFSYQGTAADVASYSWNFGTGVASPSSNTPNPSVVWNTPGNVQVGFYALGTNGCYSDTLSQTIIIHPKPIAAISSADSICQNALLALTCNIAPPAGSAFTWNLGTATLVSGNTNSNGPISVSWPLAGNQSVTLSITSPQGCISEDSIKVIHVNPIPSSQFSISLPSVCVGVNSTLIQTGVSGTNPAFTWTGLVGSTFSTPTAASTQVNFSAPGNATVSLLVVAEGCSSAVTTQNIEVLTTPTATFSADAGICQSENAQVDYTGTGTSNALFNWSYSGGTPSTSSPGLSPYSVVWSTSGSKTITLSVTEFGCSSLPFSQTVEVYPVPVASFVSTSPSCAGLNDTITYTGNAGSGATYNWSFVGSTTPVLAGQGPHYVAYTNPGIYTINLAVSENGCNSAPNQITIQVNPIPLADFTVESPVCKGANSEISYTGTSASAMNYIWNFDGGDATPGVGIGPQNVNWLTAGIKTIRLRVILQGCASSEVTYPVEVLELPLADAGINQIGCSGGSVNLGSAPIVGYTYEWSPSNGLSNSFDAQPTATAVNTTNGQIAIAYVLKVSDGQCINRDTVIYSVQEPVNVSFVSPPGQCFSQNSFSFEALGNFSANANYSWNFGPNASPSVSTLQDPTGISFTNTGQQTISVQVEDEGCLSNIYTSAVFVYEEPNVNFSVASADGCVPHRVYFTNLSSNGSGVDYVWYFGDGTSSESFSPAYTYESPGDYPVTLLVKAENGCDTALKIDDLVHIFPLPNPLFQLSDNSLVMLEDTISEVLNIQEAYSGYDSAYFRITPSFNSNSSDTLLFGSSYQIRFNRPGNYAIWHFVENEFGCTDSLLRYVNVTSEQFVFVPNAFTPDNDGVNDIFTIVGRDIQEFAMQIYNRWGERIYSTYDIEGGWDGRYNYSNNAIVSGTYYYLIRIRDSKNNWHTVDGFINVLR